MKTCSKVLVVDGDPNLRELLLSELSLAGFECVEASSCEEAWELLKKTSIYCVITDLAMEESSGVDLILKIKEDGDLKKLPIFIASGVLDINHKNARELGADKLFIKPFLVEELIEAIKEVER